MQAAEQAPPAQLPASPTSVLALSPGGAGAFGSPIAWAGNPFEAAAPPNSPLSPAAAPQPTAPANSPRPHGCAWADARAGAPAVARRQQQLVCSMLDCIGHGKSPRARQLSSLEHVSLMGQVGADFQLIESLLPLISLPRLHFLMLAREKDFPCWTIASYWHIGKALRAIRLSGRKFHLEYAHWPVAGGDTESESSGSE